MRWLLQHPAPDLNTGTRTTYCTGTVHPRIRLPVPLRILYSYSCRFTGDLQIQSRATTRSLFSARSESNPVLILPLRNRTKTYLRFSVARLQGVAARSAGSHISQFFDLLQFLGHQKIFYKTCMCAVKVALNFLPIRKSSH